MKKIENKQEKIEAVRRYFNPLIGERLSKFETAQGKFEGHWDNWFELPIRLYFGRSAVVSVAWSHFER